MLRGLYTAAAGMIAEQRRHDTITNNIANMNTPGFKQGTMPLRSFPEMLIYLMGGGNDRPAAQIGRMQNGVFAEENITAYQQGDLQETKAPTDLALISDIQVQDNQQNNIPFDANGKYVDPQGNVVVQPQAFFTVQTNDANPERRYTRNGSFQINQNGELLTSTGFQVLGADGQPIVLDREMSDLKVLPDGTFIDAATGQPVQDLNGNNIQLLISQIDNPNLLVPEGNGNFRLDNAQAQPVAVNPAFVSVKQGYIERANVDPTQSMVDLMTALRAYEANQKVIQFYDRSLDKAVNEVGRV